MKSYIQAQFHSFDRHALWSQNVLKEGGSLIFWWAAPSFVLALLVDHYRGHIPTSYLETAISEGISPHLWNVIGTVAFVLFGLTLLFPRWKFLSKSAYNVLINAYAIGGLSFGLIFGQLVTAIASASENINAWKMWLMGTGSIFLIFVSLSLNFSLWYLGHLTGSGESNSEFLRRVEQVNLRIRFVGFALFSILPCALLFMGSSVT